MEKSIKFKLIGDRLLVDVHPFETEVNGIIRVDHLQQNHKGTMMKNSTTNLTTFQPHLSLGVGWKALGESCCLNHYL